MPGISKIRRVTKETQIALRLNPDGRGRSAIAAGIPLSPRSMPPAPSSAPAPALGIDAAVGMARYKRRSLSSLPS